MTDTNTNVPADDKNTATPTDATKVAGAEENKVVTQNATATDSKAEEKKTA